jgi:dethiobiotin synthetase
MKRLFVTATNTNVGKTTIMLRLIELFGQKNIRIGVFKPIETGVTQTPLDAKKLLDEVQKYNPEFLSFKPHEIIAYTFLLPSAPFCADVDKIIDLKEIEKKAQELESKCDLLLIEGAGGLYVPITEDFFMIDLIQKLDAHTLLVTHSKLGAINDTLLSIEALKDRDISFDWCVNLYENEEDFKEITQPFYDKYFSHEWWDINNGLEDFVEHFIKELSC